MYQQSQLRAQHRKKITALPHNYSADLVDLDNEVYTFEVEASTDSEASEQAERIAFEMGIQVSYINIYKA